MKQLQRSRTDRVVGGVCGGLGKYLGIDATVVRLIWVLVTIFSAGVPGILGYILAWIIMPEEQSDRASW